MTRVNQSILTAAVLAGSMAAGAASASGQYWQVRNPSQPAVSAELAVAIARQQGFALITELELDDDKWEIDGYGQGRQELEIEISRDTGELLARNQALEARGPARPAISIEHAIDIARRGGMAVITDIELDDGKWEIEGYLSDGREAEIEISASTGDVLDVDID